MLVEEQKYTMETNRVPFPAAKYEGGKTVTTRKLELRHIGRSRRWPETDTYYSVQFSIILKYQHFTQLILQKTIFKETQIIIDKQIDNK